MKLSVIILAAVFILIACRQIGTFRLPIWFIMLLGALAVLLTGQISPAGAVQAIDVDVMLFLFGMFVVGTAFEESGYLASFCYRIFRKVKSTNALILVILFGFGITSALLMNDTMAIIGTPVVLLLAKKHQMNSKVLLLALAFSITIGSVMSPIGNPQNLLIAMNGGVVNPFVTFLRFLLLPTLINLLVTYGFLKLFYRNHFHNNLLEHSEERIKDQRLAQLSRISLIVLFVLILAKIVLVYWTIDFRLTYISLLAMLPIIVFSKRRYQLLRSIDWPTLVFFAAMFVLMKSVWETGVLQTGLARLNVNVVSLPNIFAVSIILSQVISNVPLVALYLPLMMYTGSSVKEMIALAAGSTIAGNLSILGAASNVIIIQNAEKKSHLTLTFFEFVRIGLPLTFINAVVYWLCLVLGSKLGWFEEGFLFSLPW